MKMDSKNNNRGTAKGFFFTVIVFLIVTYILLSTSLWIKTVEVSEKKFAEQFRASNLQAVFAQIKDEEINRLSKIIVKNALFKLNDYAIDHPVKAGAANELEFMNNAMEELVLYGNASDSNFDDGTSLETASSSFNTWKNTLNSSISKIGLEITEFSISDFRINQTSIDAVDYSFNLSLTISDRISTMRIDRDYKIDGAINISGFEDPAVSREVKNDNPDFDGEFGKQLFFYGGYREPLSVRPIAIGTGSQGQGWFYGPLVKFEDAGSIQNFARKKYILVGDYSDIMALADIEGGLNFGAYLLNNSPVLTPSECGVDTSKWSQSNTFNAISYPPCDTGVIAGAFFSDPFVVVENFDITTAPNCPEGRCLLFISQYDQEQVRANPSRKMSSVNIFNIEKIRDFAVCGYYTNNGNAPSYLQRLLANSYSKNSTFGIETFLLGSYVGGERLGTFNVTQLYNDSLSRIDNELFNETEGVNIRGMPGCKDKEMCNAASPVGHFKLGDGPGQGIERYLAANDISCSDGKATCSD